ncbi:MAG: hypothetical protein JO210_09490 [Acidobacteriaceae bacterium]|nr:hypothetical protein [Acidobacteriaceae bacterium]
MHSGLCITLIIPGTAGFMRRHDVIATVLPGFRRLKRLNNVFSSTDTFALNGGFTLYSRRRGAGARHAHKPYVFSTPGAVPLLGRGFHIGEDFLPRLIPPS